MVGYPAVFLEERRSGMVHYYIMIDCVLLYYCTTYKIYKDYTKAVHRKPVHTSLLHKYMSYRLVWILTVSSINYSGGSS